MKPTKRPPFDFGAPEPLREAETPPLVASDPMIRFDLDGAERAAGDGLTPADPPESAELLVEPVAVAVAEAEPAPLAEPEPSVAPEPAPMRDPAAGIAPALREAYRSEPRPLTSLSFSAAPSPMPVYAGAAVVSVLWALAPLAYAIGYRQGVSPLQNDVFAIAVFALLAVGPIALVWIAAFLLQQGRALAAESRRTRALAEELLAPTVMAANGAREAVAAVRAEIDHAASVTAEARDKMLALREVVSIESERLAETTTTSQHASRKMVRVLAQERVSMTELAAQLDSQAAAVTDTITRQAKMVAEASDLAETQLREAEAALAARAADMAAAAGEASDAARIGAEDLARQIARLETAGTGVFEQIRGVDEGLTQHRAALVAVAHALRVDQEDFAVQTESRVAQLSEVMDHARASAGELGDVARQSADAVHALTEATKDQIHDMAEAAQAERDALAEQMAHGFARIGDAAAAQRQALEGELTRALAALAQAGGQARAAAETHAEALQVRVENLGEAAFAAGRQADAIYDARLDDARSLIENSAQMIEQAAAGAAQRLEAGVQSAHTAVAELERLLVVVTERVNDLPAEAKAQAEEVKAAVERGVDELLASARRAADETQAIDTAFQDRVRRNYDMLSEAARMMGAVAGSAPGLATPRGAQHAFEAPGERPRLRLRPTATDSEFSAVFDAAGGKAPAASPPGSAEAPDGDWTWKELLTTLDDEAGDGTPDGKADGAPKAEGSDDRLAERLAGEIGGMGIDPAALLPKSRLDEITAAVQAGDTDGARAVVKSLAPAAVRRLVRRLFSDEAMREDADRFRQRYGGMLSEGVEQDREGLLVSALLTSEAGRTYLLLETAAGDLA